MFEGLSPSTLKSVGILPRSDFHLGLGAGTKAQKLVGYKLKMKAAFIAHKERSIHLSGPRLETSNIGKRTHVFPASSEHPPCFASGVL